MTINCYKKTKKSSEKKHVKYIKIFLKKRKEKGEKRPETYENLSVEEKEKSFSITVNVIRNFLRNIKRSL